MTGTETKSLYSKVYDYYKASETRIGRRAFDVLDREALGDIITDGTTFWVEHSATHADPVPDAVYTHIIKTVQNMGYKYLYEEEL